MEEDDFESNEAVNYPNDVERSEEHPIFVEQEESNAMNLPNNAERAEEHPISVDRKEISDDNLLDKVAYSEDEAYALYNEYALRTGFSIRKGKHRFYSGTRNVRKRDYLCSKEGSKLDEDPCQEKKLHRLETRTGCTAFIRFTVENGVWRVTAFNPEHNHELASPSERHLLRSGRQISKPKAGVIDSMVNAGIRTKNTYSYLRKEVGGSENVGFTKRDCYNFVNKQKMMMIGAGDSQSLLNHFKLKHAKDPMFFYTIQVDQENRMTNFFWRDGRERIDYDCFGDVVAFDTTYRTNKYNMICAPFVGVNHHWQNVMFGCAFLLDETIDSFKWLFKSFLESMGNRPPITIFTEQDQAMSRAIEEVLPNTHHRICLWHVSKNAPSHLGPLITEPEFKYLFNKCQKYCDSEQEFEQTWDKMMQKFNLGNHQWLNMMYKIRHKWSTAFTKDSFTAEMKASSRSESTNHVLNGIANKTTTLTKFVVEYDNLVDVMRSVELEEDFRCKQGAPQRAVENSGILDHAAQVYTCKIFMFFQTELLNSLAMKWEKVDCQNTIEVFEVKQENGQRVRTVHFNLLNNNITCSCKKFESLGILCCHVLRVFSVKNLTRIPSEYILKRWTKEAKKGMMTYEQNCNSLVNDEDVEIIWRNSMIRIANTAISKSQGEDSLKQICQTALLGLGEKIEREFSRLKMGTNVNSNEHQVGQCEITNDSHCLPNDMSLLDPPSVRSKGIRNTRLKWHFEKRKTISSKDASSLRKSKQVRQEPSHVSFGTSPYQPPIHSSEVSPGQSIFQPPVHSSNVRSTSASLFSQSNLPRTMQTQNEEATKEIHGQC